MDQIQLLAQEIAQTGVPYVFGIPGSGKSYSLLDALEKANVQFCLTHFEGTGVLMAGAAGRLAGRAGVALGIKGPGLANMVPGLAACYLEGFPVVTLSEAYPEGTPMKKAHKRMDHDGLISAVTKGRWSLSAKDPNFFDLSNFAENEVPGPVHVDLEDLDIGAENPTSRLPEGIPNPDQLQKIEDLVLASKRPALIVGTYAIRQRWTEKLNQLQVPVFSTAAAKGVVDEKLRHAAGVYTGVGSVQAPESVILPKSDLVIGIGLRHHEVLAVKPFPCPAINIDQVGTTLGSGFEFFHVADGNFDLANLFKILAQKSWGEDLIEQSILGLRACTKKGSFSPARAYEMVEEYFQGQARLILDTGHFCTIGEHLWRVQKPQWYLSSGKGRYMGIGLPIAIGASLYDSSIPTVVFLGDGGIGMFIAEVKIAVQRKLPLLIILMTDGYLGSIRTRAIRDKLNQQMTLIHKPSWRKVFDGFDMPAISCETPDQLEEALRSWIPNLTGPLFIELPFESDEYQTIPALLRG